MTTSRFRAELILPPLHQAALQQLHYAGRVSEDFALRVSFVSMSAPKTLMAQPPERGFLKLEGDCTEPLAFSLVLQSITLVKPLKNQNYLYEAYLKSPLLLLQGVEQSMLVNDYNPELLIQSLLTEGVDAASTPPYSMQNIKMDVDPHAHSILPWIIAYRESRYDFLKRVAHAHGMSFFHSVRTPASMLAVTRRLLDVSKPIALHQGGFDAHDFSLEPILTQSRTVSCGGLPDEVLVTGYRYQSSEPDIQAQLSLHPLDQEDSKNSIAMRYHARFDALHLQTAEHLVSDYQQAFHARREILQGRGQGISIAGDSLTAPHLRVNTLVHSAAWSLQCDPFEPSRVAHSALVMEILALEGQYRDVPRFGHLAGVLAGGTVLSQRGETTLGQNILDTEGHYQLNMPFFFRRRGRGTLRGIRRVHRFHSEDHQMHVPLPAGSEVTLLFHNDNPDWPLLAGATHHHGYIANTHQKTSQNLYWRDHQGHQLAFINEGKFDPLNSTGRATATLLHNPAYNPWGDSAFFRMGDATHEEKQHTGDQALPGFFALTEGSFFSHHDGGHVQLLGNLQSLPMLQPAYRFFAQKSLLRGSHHHLETLHVQDHHRTQSVSEAVLDQRQNHDSIREVLQAKRHRIVHEADMHAVYHLNRYHQLSGDQYQALHQAFTRTLKTPLYQVNHSGQTREILHQDTHQLQAKHLRNRRHAQSMKIQTQSQQQNIQILKQHIHTLSQQADTHVQVDGSALHSADRYQDVAGTRVHSGPLLVHAGLNMASHKAPQKGPHWFALQYRDLQNQVIEGIGVKMIFEDGQEVLQTQGTQGIYVAGVSSLQAKQVMVGHAQDLEIQIQRLQQQLKLTFHRILDITAHAKSQNTLQTPLAHESNQALMASRDLPALRGVLRALVRAPITQRHLQDFTHALTQIAPEEVEVLIRKLNAWSTEPVIFAMLLHVGPHALGLASDTSASMTMQKAYTLFIHLAHLQSQECLTATFENLPVNEHHIRMQAPDNTLTAPDTTSFNHLINPLPLAPQQPDLLQITLCDQTQTSQASPPVLKKLLDSFVITATIDAQRTQILTLKQQQGVLSFDAMRTTQIQLELSSPLFEGQSVYIIGQDSKPCSIAENHLMLDRQTWLQKTPQIDTQGRKQYAFSFTILPPAQLINFRQDAGGSSLTGQETLTYNALKSYFTEDADSLMHPSSDPVLDPEILEFYHAMGHNITFFIHGYNVPFGSFSPSYLPDPREALELQSPALMTYQYQKLMIPDPEHVSGLYRNSALMQAWYPDQYQPSQVTHLNGHGAHGWLLSMEHNLNQAAGFDGKDYLNYTRIVGIAWQGNPTSSLDYMAALPLSQYPARRLAQLIQQLKQAGLCVNLMAHSLGNAVLMNTLEDLSASKTSVDHVFLWEAAIPNTSFNPVPIKGLPMILQNQTLNYGYSYPHAHQAADKITVLYSDEDTILGDIPPSDSSLDIIADTGEDPAAGAEMVGVTAAMAVINQGLSPLEKLQGRFVSIYHLSNLLVYPVSFFAQAVFADLESYFERWARFYKTWQIPGSPPQPLNPELLAQRAMIKTQYPALFAGVRDIFNFEDDDKGHVNSSYQQVLGTQISAREEHLTLGLILYLKANAWEAEQLHAECVATLIVTALLTPQASPVAALGYGGVEQVTAMQLQRTDQLFQTAQQDKKGNDLCFDHSAMKVPDEKMRKDVYQRQLMHQPGLGFTAFGLWPNVGKPLT